MGHSSRDGLDPATRTRLRRMQQLGLVREYEHFPQSGRVDLINVHTTAGDVWTGELPKLHAYLDGISHGAWAAQRSTNVRSERGAISTSRASGFGLGVLLALCIMLFWGLPTLLIVGGILLLIVLASTLVEQQIRQLHDSERRR